MVHIKDFYVRSSEYSPGEGWFRSAHGHYLRGAIVGHGDIDMPRVLRIVKQSGYDGYLSVEFEGLEPCKQGARAGLNQLKAMWEAL
jgi:sugar phosphate isomerase/epimerase